MERLDGVSSDAERYGGDNQRSNGEERLTVPCRAPLFRSRKEGSRGEGEVFSDSRMHNLEVVAPGAAQSSSEPRIDDLAFAHRQQEQSHLGRAFRAWLGFCGRHSAAGHHPVGVMAAAPE